MSILNQLRPSDFVILKGVAKESGKPFEFAKLDSRCNLTNDEAFLKGLREEGTRVVDLEKK